MKVSTRWLKKYVALDQAPSAIERALTMLGFEVEGVEETGIPPLENVVVGEVLEHNPHPNADRLSVCLVDAGPEHGRKTIVCGARNYKVGDRVPVALPGALLPGGFKIKKSKLRGVASDGMMCSGSELGHDDDADGLLILSDSPALGLGINEVFPEGDVVFDIEVTPNRPDCLSHLGLARELAAHFGLKLKYPDIRFSGTAANQAGLHGLLDSVVVESDELCPLYLAHVISGVKVGPSPLWMQGLLRAVGLRPINNIVDVTNYVLLESGQPLHAFDAAQLKGNRIVIRTASNGEVFTTLDGKERKLSSRMLTIADGERTVAIAGVMGGESSEVSDETTDIVLESAYFRPSGIRWTSRRLGLSTDSSYRFERGVDALSVSYAAYRAIDLILETAGGKVCDPIFKVGAEKAWDNEIRLSPAYVRKRLGFDISDDTIRESLESLELRVDREEEDEENGGVIWTIAIPSFRLDLDRPIDLVEEILRVHGTDKIPPASVISPGIVSGDDPVTVFTRAASGYLVGQDFHECINYTLRSGDEIKHGFSNVLAEELKLANPIIEDQTHLRATLVPGLIDVLKLNQARHTGASHLFECGRIFREREGAVDEMIGVGFAIGEDLDRVSWRKTGAADFFAAKRRILRLAALAGIDTTLFEVEPLPVTEGGWQSGHAAGYDDPEGRFTVRFGLLDVGELHRENIRGKVVAGLLTVSPEFLATKGRRAKFQPFSSYPPALRDLALIVDRSTPSGRVGGDLLALGRKTIEGEFELAAVDLFDLYEGDGLPEGARSLAFSLSYGSITRTLTDDEVNTAFGALVDMIEKDTPYRVRR
ncbi:MAG: phenylalanine--tRNA ligase subunit beta [Verrucomicrobia bacterium]|nr:MAG: phenylalanine--tRNA ligase subunit beta [Verrucomicrobiota bacterium]